jgi:hypothetical protein
MARVSEWISWATPRQQSQGQAAKYSAARLDRCTKDGMLADGRNPAVLPKVACTPNMTRWNNPVFLSYFQVLSFVS